jgi:hypothetical protein
MCFDKSAEQTYLEENVNFSRLKCVTFRKYSFQNTLQLSKGINVLNAVVSIVHGYLWRDTCVSLTQLNRPIWRKQSISPP